MNETISRLGLNQEDLHFSIVFQKWFNKLFKLTPLVEEKLNSTLRKAKPNELTPLICVQVRIGGARTNVKYDQNITPRNFSTYYWDFIEEKFLNHIRDYRIFVTADTESVEKEAVRRIS